MRKNTVSGPTHEDSAPLNLVPILLGERTRRIWRTGDIGSVLDLALILAREGRLDIWDSVLARSQSQGRGQMRRSWQSPAGNLYAAIRLPLLVPFSESGGAVAVGVLLAQAIRQTGLPLLLKWPNDLVISPGDRPFKIGGILLEERGGTLLAGIGINLNSCPDASWLRSEAAMPAARLLEYLPKIKICTDPGEFWQYLVKCMYQDYVSQPFLKNWERWANDFLLWRNRQVELLEAEEKRCRRGLLLGLCRGGGLALQSGNEIFECWQGSLKLCSDS